MPPFRNPSRRPHQSPSGPSSPKFTKNPRQLNQSNKKYESSTLASEREKLGIEHNIPANIKIRKNEIIGTNMHVGKASTFSMILGIFVAWIFTYSPLTKYT